LEENVSSPDYRDIIGGLLLTALGVFIVVSAQRYELGTLSSMGPGYFPTMLGGLMAVFGLMIAVPALFRTGESLDINWRGYALVVGSLIFFALALRPLGLLLTTAISVFISSLASSAINLKGRLVLVVCVLFLTYVIFVLGLSMRLPLLPRGF